MESSVQSAKDYLIDGLSFQLAPGASYITRRRSVSFFPQGGNSYSSTGVKVIKINFNGSDWLDPSTTRLQFTLVNDDAVKGLRPIGGPHSFFRRVRVLVGCTVVEDIDDANRVAETMNILSPQQVRDNVDMEGFDLPVADDYVYRGTDLKAKANPTYSDM